MSITMHPQKSKCKLFSLNVILKYYIMSTRVFCCNKSPDQFCFICGKWVKIRERRQITHNLSVLYKQYFNMDTLHKEDCWVPHFACSRCISGLGRWSKGNGHLPFGRPMIWIDPINHEENCYICKTKVVYSKNMEESVRYASGSSAKLPVLHTDGIPVPVPPGQCFSQIDCMEEESETEDLFENPAYQRHEREDPLYIPDTEETHLLSQGELNDLHRDLALTKQMSELLTSRLQEWKLLDPGVLVTATRERSEYLAKCFAMHNKICYCKNIEELFLAMKEPFVSREWRLFIDGSKTSIKAVLLHNGNVKPSIPVAFPLHSLRE